MKRLLCLFGIHSRVVRYVREGVYLHYVAVCRRCGDVRPAPHHPERPQVVRIPPRRERRQMLREARRG